MTSLRTLTAALLFAAPLLAVPVGAPLAAQEPVRPMPAASAPPPAPATAPKVVPPPVDAVAQCNDLTFVVAPAEPAACASRGGVKVFLPGIRRAPVPTAAAAAMRAADARSEARPATIPRTDAPPAGATMRCRDGSWLTGAPAASRCDRNGGLAVILPVAPPAPPRTP